MSIATRRQLYLYIYMELSIKNQVIQMAENLSMKEKQLEMTRGHRIFNASPGFQSWTKMTTDTYSLANQSMNSNHSTAVRKKRTVHNKRKKYNIPKKMKKRLILR